MTDFEVTEVQEINSNPTLQDGLVQVKAQYTTAVSVIKKRDLTQVIAQVENEAALAGDEFFYNYPQGDKRVEGIAIGGALIIARCFGNCAINTRPVEYADKYIVHADFIDFETGFNLTRSYMGKKKVLKNRYGKPIYDSERNDEIVYQIITSKAIRNVVANGVPKYLISKGISAAKTNIRKKLEQLGKEKSTQLILKRAEDVKVPVDRIEENFGKVTSWDIDKMIMVIGAIRMVEEGYGTINDAFPKNGLTEEEVSIPSNNKQESEPIVEKVEDLTQNLETDWENVESVILKINSIKTKKELVEFKKTNKLRLQAFGGSDFERITNAIISIESKLK